MLPLRLLLEAAAKVRKRRLLPRARASDLADVARPPNKWRKR